MSKRADRAKTVTTGDNSEPSQRSSKRPAEKPRTERDSRVKREVANANNISNKLSPASMEKCSVVLDQMNVEKYFESISSSTEATSLKTTSKSPSNRPKRAAKTAITLSRPRVLRNRTILPQPSTSAVTMAKTKTAVKKTSKNAVPNVIVKKEKDSVIVIDDSDDEIEDNKAKLKTETEKSSISQASVPTIAKTIVSSDGERPTSVLNAKKEQQEQSVNIQITNVFINVVETEPAKDPKQIELSSVENPIRGSGQHTNQRTATADLDRTTDEILVGTITAPGKSSDNMLNIDMIQNVCAPGAGRISGNEATTGPESDEHLSQTREGPSTSTSINQCLGDAAHDDASVAQNADRSFSSEDEFDMLVKDKIKLTSLSFILPFRESNDRSTSIITQSMDSSIVSGIQDIASAAAAPTAIKGESSYAVPEETGTATPVASTETSEGDEHADGLRSIMSADLGEAPKDFNIVEPISSGVPVAPTTPSELRAMVSENHQPILPLNAASSMTYAENDPNGEVVQQKEAFKSVSQTTILSAELGAASNEIDIVETIASKVLDASATPPESDVLTPLGTAESTEPTAISNNEEELKITPEKVIEQLSSSILNIEHQPIIVAPSRVPENDQHVVPMILNPDAANSQNSSEAKVMQPKEVRESASTSKTSIVASTKRGGTSMEMVIAQTIASEKLVVSPIPSEPSQLTAFEPAASSSLTVSANNEKVPVAHEAIEKLNTSNANELHSSIGSIAGHLKNVHPTISPNGISISANLEKGSDANVEKSNQVSESIPPAEPSIAAPIVANRFSLANMPSPMKRFLVKPKTKPQNNVAADAMLQVKPPIANFDASAIAVTNTPNENASTKIDLAQQNVPTPVESTCSVSIPPCAKMPTKDKAADGGQPKRKNVRKILTASGVVEEEALILTKCKFNSSVVPLVPAPHGFSVEWNSDQFSTAPRLKKRGYDMAFAKSQEATWEVEHLFDNFERTHIEKRPRMSNEFDVVSNRPVRNLVASKTRPKRIHDILRLGKIRWWRRQRRPQLEHPLTAAARFLLTGSID